MDFLKKEIISTEEFKSSDEEFCISPLSELQLVLVGGGVGETIVG